VVNAVLDQVGSWPALLVLTVAAVVLVLESGVVFGVVLPGSTTLVVLGLWSAGSGTSPALPIAVAAAASIAGALLGWRQGHQRRRTRPGHGRLRARVDPAVRRARSWLTTLGPGGSAVVLAAAHWAAVTRTLTPRVAGGAGVPLRLVAPVLAVSGTVWATTVVLLARTLGQRVATDAGWVPAVVLVVVVGALLVRARARHRTLTRS
jgi:membrane protein DedA with SNARE-associated domain